MNWKIFIAALTAFGLNSFGQGGVIVRGGLNLANVKSSADLPTGVTQGFRTGMNVALLGDVPINNMFHGLTGVGFENRGFTTTDASGNSTVKLDYVTFSLMLQVGMPLSLYKSGPQPRLFVNAGVEPAFLISAVNEVKKGAVDTSIDLRDNTIGFDMNLSGEVGGEIPFTSSLAGILGAGYSYGLINANNTPGSKVTDHNYEIRIFAGLKFGLPKLEK